MKKPEAYTLEEANAFSRAKLERELLYRKALSRVK
jgi:hypothetical protein